MNQQYKKSSGHYQDKSMAKRTAILYGVSTLIRTGGFQGGCFCRLISTDSSAESFTKFSSSKNVLT